MLNEVVIGLDPHKVSNTIVVLERDETLLTRRRFVHDDDGFVAMFAAVAEFPKRVWAVEGANGMGRNIAQRLVAAGETVIDVPAKLSTRVRVCSTGHGTKTDHAAGRGRRRHRLTACAHRARSQPRTQLQSMPDKPPHLPAGRRPPNAANGA